MRAEVGRRVGLVAGDAARERARRAALGGNASPDTSALVEARQRDAQLVGLLEDDLEERRRADVAVRLQVGHRLHLLLGLADAAREHRAAQRVRAGLEHRARRREVVGEAVVDEVAAAEARREQRPRASRQ